VSDHEPPPPLAVVGPDGRRAIVEPASDRHTVGELADALGVPRRAGVLVDGRRVDRRVRLDRAGIVAGSRIVGRRERPACCAEGGGRPPADGCAERAVVVTVEAGPAAGAMYTLVPGRHVVGRSPRCAIRLDDDLVELHHAALDVAATGEVRLVQLSGRVPCDANGPVVTVGASRLRIGIGAAGDRLPAALSPRSDDPWRLALHRRPRQPAVWAPSPIDPPAPEAARPLYPSGGILAALLSSVGAIALAVIARQPLYLILGGAALLAAIGATVHRRLRDRTSLRRRTAESRRDVDRFAADIAAQRDARLALQRRIVPPLAEVLKIAGDLGHDVWARRAAHPDCFAVALGWGEVPWEATIGSATGELSADAQAHVERHRLLDDVPVTVELGPGQAIALVGAHAAAVARAVVVQLATLSGPADWRLLAVVDDVAEWDWCAWLPHASIGAASPDATVVAADDGARLVAALGRLDDSDGRHVVVVTDRPDTLSTRTGPLRRYVSSAPSVAIVALVPAGGVAPSLCRSELRVGSMCTGRWTADVGASSPSCRVHAAGLSVSAAGDAARRLAGLHDPEDPAEATGACPSSVMLSHTLARGGGPAIDDPIAIAAGWRAESRPRGVIGMTADGVVELDLVADGPHALIAGTTGAGKSELLRSLVATLATGSSPDELTFVLIDYKGGSTFDACADLPHTVGVVTDLDERLAERALISLEAELRRRERMLRAAGVDDLDSYRAAAQETPLPRLVVVIDEFAALAAELPGFLTSLVGVAQRGRSLGIHLVLATQRPAGVVSEEIRANTNLRIALRLQDRADAVDIVGVADPAAFPRGAPGRALLRLGAGETVVFQAARSSGPYRPPGDGHLRVHRTTSNANPRHRHRAAGADAAEPASELATLMRAIRAASSLCEIHPPFRPWLPPLPERLSAEAVGRLGDGADDILGLVDDPAGQRQVPLRWNPAEGNLAILGALGCGTTTALRSVVIATGESTHSYVVDARGDGRLADLASLPGCGGVVGGHDAERRIRLVRFLADELARRRGTPASPRVPIILAIDGLGALLAAMSAPADRDDHARLLGVLGDGVPVGIHTVATVERPGGVAHSAFAALPQRWLLHVDDPLECATLGVRASAIPPAIPGRIVIAGSGLAAQLAVLPVRSLAASRSVLARPTAIGALAEDVDAASLPASHHRDGVTSLAVGIDFATLGTARIDVPDGEHVLVVGPARSGRSTALIRLVGAWRDAHADGVVVLCCPRPDSPALSSVAAAGDVVVAADEAAIVEAVASIGPNRRVCVAVDDAERVADAAGRLLALAGERARHVAVIAAGRPDALRSMYGHWTAVVRRSRLGLVMSTGSDSDGELLGEPLPRRSPVPPRVGLAWLIDGRGNRLVQVGRHTVAAASPVDEPRRTASRHDTRLPLLRIERE
jgi:S-DNA-T family DNA segregation ATPase FtsK/SpoIIIE